MPTVARVVGCVGSKELHVQVKSEERERGGDKQL
jgi:hypothetical protein